MINDTAARVAREAVRIAQRAGAQPVTLRAPLGTDGRLERAAAYRLPLEHPRRHVADRMHACGQLNERRYTNACAWLRLCHEAGAAPQVTADYTPLATRGAADAGEEHTPADDHRALLRHLPAMMGMLLMDMARDTHPGVRWLATLQAALDRLDHLPRHYDGEPWRADEDWG